MHATHSMQRSCNSPNAHGTIHSAPCNVHTTYMQRLGYGRWERSRLGLSSRQQVVVGALLWATADSSLRLVTCVLHVSAAARLAMRGCGCRRVLPQIPFLLVVLVLVVVVERYTGLVRQIARPGSLPVRPRSQAFRHLMQPAVIVGKFAAKRAADAACRCVVPASQQLTAVAIHRLSGPRLAECRSTMPHRLPAGPGRGGSRRHNRLGQSGLTKKTLVPKQQILRCPK